MNAHVPLIAMTWMALAPFSQISESSMFCSIALTMTSMVPVSAAILVYSSMRNIHNIIAHKAIREKYTHYCTHKDAMYFFFLK